MTANLRGALLMVASMAGFAVEDLLLKSAARHVPVGQVALMMGLAGMAVFAAIALRAGQRPVPRAILSPVMALRSLAEVGGRLFYALAIALIPLSTASAILQATPILVVLGAAVLFGEKVGARRWVLIGLGFAGVLMIIRPGVAGFDALSLLAVAGMAGFAARDLATRAAPLSLSDAQLGVVGFAMLALSGAVLLGWSGGAVWPDAWALALVAGTTLFGLLGYGFLTRAMRTGEVSAVTPFRYSRLIFALILGVVVLGERPDAFTLAGAALIVGCGLALMLGPRRA
jgi:drug/metabolite transporter (DMT)-like permease